jgi:hypothetical protein
VDQKSQSGNNIVDCRAKEGKPSDKGNDSVLNNFLELMPVHRSKNKHGHSVAFSVIGSSDELCNRACLLAPLDTHRSLQKCPQFCQSMVETW